ncbi:DNA-binding protein RFX8 [Terrapene carolina triunguis]|uniref:DNA-binding protein RFX8 n=1 Tax=Terrapene triunguis TaxID=2587831 RepID=UPI000E774175|nr:DNA-binding protein RFX8 [Terrapene carolina triunguis]
MAEGAEAAPNSSSSRLYQSITQWIADNFYVCEGYSIPRCLLYEMYIENCTQNAQTQVNPATFGKLVRLVFPDLGTRRLGTRGSARYHYDGIYIKKSSSFYAHYCYLLAEKKNHSGDGSSSEDAANYESNGYRKGTSGINLQTEKDKFGSPLPEFKRFSSWEQELGKTHSYKIVALLADEYCNYCQDVLQNLRNNELDRVEDLIMSFWKSLQPETIMLMSLPDICQLFKCYDRQLFKEMESILLDDFLQDVPIQYLKSVRLFSKNVKLWLLTVLEDFPLLLRMSKIKEVTVFVKRLRRKTYLSNMAKTMRIVLNNNSRVTVLKSDLNAIINQGIVDIPGNPLQKKFRNMDEMESDMELKCLNNLISLLDTSTDVRVFLNCMSSNLQAFVIQPSKNKEEFRKLAANFQLRWNFLLTAVSKAMTLCHTDSFGSWHLFNLLLLEYVIHILQSHIEEEGDGTLSDMQQNDSPTQLVREPAHLWDNFSAEQFRAGAPEPTRVTLTQSQSDVNLNSIILRVLSCLVDSATGNKLIQVMLEDKATKSSVKLNLPVGKEALVTLKDGQRFIIRTCDSQQSCTSICSREIQTDL